MSRGRKRLVFSLLLCSVPAYAHEIPRAPEAPVIDGNPGDASWQLASWRPIDKPVFDTRPAAADFSGRYKTLWTPEYLYLLAEITDDILIDARPDPLENYWEDDTLEIFIDEDASGGNHQYNHSAFAYHIALDNQVVDIAPFANDEQRRLGKNNVQTFPSHVTAKWKRSNEAPHRIYWEVRIAVFSDRDGGLHRETLSAGKIMGLMVAYCDADGPEGRKHFMTDVEIAPVNGDRNRGYIDAGVFGRVTLAGPAQATGRGREQ